MSLDGIESWGSWCLLLVSFELPSDTGGTMIRRSFGGPIISFHLIYSKEFEQGNEEDLKDLPRRGDKSAFTDVYNDVALLPLERKFSSATRYYHSGRAIYQI